MTHRWSAQNNHDGFRMRHPLSLRVLVLAVSCTVAAVSSPALAQKPRLDLSLPRVAEIAADPSTSQIDERLDFLEQRLEAAQTAGQLWHYGWLGIYGAGLIANGTEAALADDGDDLAAPLVGIGKTTFAITRLLMEPLPARLGADPIRAMPNATPEQAAARLRAAEALLLESADRAREKYTLWPHLSNALINLAGGGIILAFDDWKDAAMSTGLGLAFGEIKILTMPERALDDLAAYEGRYGPVPPADVGWYLVPRRNGVALVLRF